ncbi:DNA primase, partial [Patescibacteria group bacterium]|nr:DNA primase [Patescibacteria group bacterium]
MADQIEEIKSKTDIVAVIGEHIELKKAGRNYKANCPFHGEKIPSFNVSPELQIFKCFGCFPKGQFIKTPFGLCQIQNLTEGEYVFSGKGQIKKILATHKREYEGDLISVRLSMFGETVSLTSDHMVYIIGGSRLYKYNYKYLSGRFGLYKKRGYSRREQLQRLWRFFPIEKIRAGALKKGMTLLYPIDTTIRDVEVIDLSEYITKKWPSHGKKPLIPPLEIPIDEDFLKLIGYYIAEGSNHRAHIRFSLGNHEEKFASEIVCLCRRVFGLESSIYRRPTNKRTGIEITCCNSILANIFENLCGKGAEKKHVPHIFQQLPLHKQKILLESIFKGDGHERLSNKAKHPDRTMITVSRILADQLRDILVRIGYFPSQGIEMGKVDKMGVNHKKSYRVYWSTNAQVAKFKRIYEDQEGNEFWLLPILRTKKSKFKGKVYNLTIEGDHSYIANTFAVANCGEAGDAFTFLQKYEGMDFYEALKFLADRAGVKLKKFKSTQTDQKTKLYEINSLANRFYNYVLLKHALGKFALDYLVKNRGLKLDTIKKFQLGYSPDRPLALKKFLVDKKKIAISDLEKAGIVYARDGRVFDRFRGRVIFPLFDHRGNITGFAGRILPGLEAKKLAKYINTPETEIYHKSRMLYGFDVTKREIKKSGEAVVVEGELDMISSWQIGIKNAVAIKGSALTQEQVKLLSRYAQKLVLAMDSDVAGGMAARRGIEIAEREGLDVNVANLGKFKDPDDMARAKPNELILAINNAVGAWDFIIDFVFSQHKEKGGEKKAKVSREIVPVLASIGDKIVQAHYVKIVAEKLNVPVEAVSQQVFNVYNKSATLPEVEIISKTKQKTRRELLEERLLAVSFAFDPLVLRKRNIYLLVLTPL